MKNINIRWLSLASGLIILLLVGLIYAWSVFSLNIAAEFPAWSKSQLSLTFTLMMASFCLGGIASGLMLKKLSTTKVIMISASMFLVGFFLVSRTQSLSQLYLSFGIICGLASGFSYNSVISTVSRWFPDKKGLISGVLLMAFGAGSFLIGLIYQSVLQNTAVTWRKFFFVLGGVMFVTLTVLSVFVKRPLEKTADVAQTEREIPPSDVLRSSSFWLYYVWAILMSAAGLAVISQGASFASEIYTAKSSSGLAVIVGLLSIFNSLGRVAFGFVFDRYGYGRTMLCVTALYVITGIIMLVTIKSHLLVLLCMTFILAGFSYGGVTPINAAYISSRFGMKYYSVNFSLINTNLLVASLGSTIAASLYDKTGSYVSICLMIFALSLGSFVITALLSGNKFENTLTACKISQHAAKNNLTDA